MRFLELTLTAFGPFATPVTIPLAHQGLVLVEGQNLDAGDAMDSNAAGKSMLFEAILWTLFGKLARYGNRQLGGAEVCNAQTGLAKVAVSFESGGATFRVERLRRMTGSAKVTITTAQGVPLPESALHAHEHDLASLVGFEYETARTALFLQGTGLTLATAGFTSQMQTLESVLRFDVMTRAQEIAKKRQRDLSTEETIARADIVRWAEIALSSRRAMDHLESLGEDQEEENLKAEITRRAEAWETRITQIDNLHRALRDWPDVEARIDLLSRRLQSNEVRLSELQDLVGRAECYVCQSPLAPERVPALIATAQDILAVLQADLVVPQASRLQCQEWDRQRQDLEAENRRDQEIAQLRRADLTSLLDRKARRFQLIEQEQTRMEEAVEKEGEATKRVLTLTHELKKAAFWARAFGPDGVKSYLLGTALPVLNQAAAQYGDLLSDGSLRVRFNASRSSRADDMLELTGPGSNEYLGCSMGERRRVSIVLALAFRALSRWRMADSVNVGLWDEVFDGLDESGIRRLVNVLQQDMDEQETVFVITHSPHVKALFPGAKILRVVKEGGTSTVQWA